MNFRFTINRALVTAFIFSATMLSLPVRATEVAGVKLDETAKVANQELKLNGAGIRYKLFFKVYVAALYLSDKKSTVPQILAAPGAKRIHLVMLRDVSSEDFGQAFMAGMRKNSDMTERAKIINQMMIFGELFASIPELKKGDVLTTDWIPGSGTVCSLNGKKISQVIPDVAFYNALLKIWLGRSPADEKLKRALLGEKEEPAVTPRTPTY
ncbi:MAG TPA: lipoprotein transmembrane [Oxalobacteraceae bacterium]|nr:lipoprotein transmembrane [Oxalobacteraceae bacterium]HCN91400.1 lipoprotein transmembrane [Oxalobacteraceae bacterium]